MFEAFWPSGALLVAAAGRGSNNWCVWTPGGVRGPVGARDDDDDDGDGDGDDDGDGDGDDNGDGEDDGDGDGGGGDGDGDGGGGGDGGGDGDSNEENKENGNSENGNSENGLPGSTEAMPCNPRKDATCCLSLIHI